MHVILISLAQNPTHLKTVRRPSVPDTDVVGKGLKKERERERERERQEEKEGLEREREREGREKGERASQETAAAAVVERGAPTFRCTDGRRRSYG